MNITPKQLEKEKSKPGYRQCSASYSRKTKGGNLTLAWCQRNRGHEGDHRGYRTQW
jgi:hypothetical protein